MLAAGQNELADRFEASSGVEEAERFSEGNCLWTAGGVSVLADAAVVFVCVVEEFIPRNTHLIGGGA